MNQEELDDALGEQIYDIRWFIYGLTFVFLYMGFVTFKTNKIFSILSFSAMFLSFYLNARNERTIF